MTHNVEGGQVVEACGYGKSIRYNWFRWCRHIEKMDNRLLVVVVVVVNIVE